MKKPVRILATTAALALLLSACGGGSTESGGTATKADAATFEGRGEITYVQGKDNNGTMQKLLDKWNADHPDEKVKFIELSSSADEQRASFVNNAQTKSDAYCVISVDVVWVAEFAANQWVEPLPMDKFDSSRYLAGAWKAALYRDQLYALPTSSDGGILYYRADLLKEAGIDKPATTYKEMMEHWEKVKALPGHEKIGGFAGQMAKYEGLTVNTAEFINSAGGKFLDDAGAPVVDSKEAIAGLQRLSDGFSSGFIPREAVTYKEEEGRAAFEDGRLLYYRNWPYQQSLSEKALGDASGFAPLPTVEGKPWSSSLGGHNAAIAKGCKNKATALDFVTWMGEKDQQMYNLKESSLAPVYTEIYDDKDLQKQFPYLPALKKSIENATPRPQAVAYGDVSAAIQDAVFPVLQGESKPEAAAKELQEKLTEILKK